MIAPGTTDAFAYWVAGDSGIVIAAVYVICGPVPGLATLAADLAALLAGLSATGRAIAASAWLGTLISPVIGAGLAVGFLAAFRGLSRYTESQLAEYGERVRRQARAEAMSRVDSAALEDARRVAGPVLDLVASGQAPDANLRLAAALANATLRDELLAPGFLTADLAEHVRAARIAGARVTVDIPRHGDVALAETGRELLAAALADLDAGDDVTLQVHRAAEGHPALLLLRVRSARSGHVALRRSAGECGALVSDLGEQRTPAPASADTRAHRGPRRLMAVLPLSGEPPIGDTAAPRQSPTLEATHAIGADQGGPAMGTGFLTRAAVFPVSFVTAWVTPTPAAAPAAYAALTPATASAAARPRRSSACTAPARGQAAPTAPTRRRSRPRSPRSSPTSKSWASTAHGWSTTRTRRSPSPATCRSTGRRCATTIDEYAGELEAELESFSHSCPDTPISLVGYSLGALLINNMLSSYSGEWNFIDAVELYGDPCWYNPHGDYRGLARYAATVGLRLGCFPENAYPYPLVSPAGFQFQVQSLCTDKDPICGQGWPPYEIGGQIIAAALCGLDRCPHLSYSGAPASDAAELLAESAFKRPGGDG